MDPPANHQNANDLHWFHYLEENPHLTWEDNLFDIYLEMVDHPNQVVPPMELDQNYICNDQLGFQDFDLIEDLSLWDWQNDNDLQLYSHNHDTSDVITEVKRIDHDCNVTSGEANTSTATAADDDGGRKRGDWLDDDHGLPFYSCNSYVNTDHVNRIDHDCYVTSGEDNSATADHGGRKRGRWDNSLPLLSWHDDDMRSDGLKPIDLHDHVTGEAVTSGGGGDDGGRKGGRRSMMRLELEEIEKHFGMPITMAAKELNVGLTMLKKRCRELNIKRWPHRKLKSLKSLIQNVKELGLEEEMKMLEEHKRMMEKVPELELTERTKKLRQACFKFNYKKRRLLIDQSPSY